MAQYKEDIVDIDLASGFIHRNFKPSTIGSKDSAADRIGVRVFRKGSAVDVSSLSCYGYFHNSHGENIALTAYGTTDGNIAYVTLPQACYNYEGPFWLAIKLIGGGITGTVRIVDGVVDNTHTNAAVAPTGAVPTYSEILAQYDAMVAATAVANASLAPQFSQLLSYPAGFMVIVDGAMYILPNGHVAGETWNNTEHIPTTMSDQVSPLHPQYDTFNIYDKNNNLTYKFINNNGEIMSSVSHCEVAVVPVEPGKKYSICRIGYQQYESGKMIITAADKETVLDIVAMNLCRSIIYDGYIAKVYKVTDENAAYMMFNVKAGAGDSINSTIVTDKNINGPQLTVLSELYGTQLATPYDTADLSDRITVLEADKTGHDRVSLLITEDQWQVRSDWNDTQDIAVKGFFHGSANGAFTMSSLDLFDKETDPDIYGGDVLCLIGDDVCPIKLLNTYIGGAHGFPASWTLTTSSDHGLTEAVIGKTFTDAANLTYVILSIPASNKIYVCSTYMFNLDAPLSTTAPTSPMTLNGTSYAFSCSSTQQLRPSINNLEQHVTMNGDRIVSGSGIYNGAFAEITESYSIINVGEMLSYLADHVGSNTNKSYYSDAISGYCRMTNRYRFTEHGAVTLYCDMVWYTANEIEYIGVIQTAAMGGDYLSIPKSSYDCITDINGSNVNVRVATWKNENVPPRAYYNFTNENMAYGMAAGFHNIGNGKDSIRKNEISNAAQYYANNHKYYPRLIESRQMSEGEYVSAIAFRCPSWAATRKPFVNWYYVDDTPFVMVNVQNNFKGYIKMPEHFCGKLATLIETDGNFELRSTFVNTEGLYIEVRSYGYGVIQLGEKSLSLVGGIGG